MGLRYFGKKSSILNEHYCMNSYLTPGRKQSALSFYSNPLQTQEYTTHYTQTNYLEQRVVPAKKTKSNLPLPLISDTSFSKMGGVNPKVTCDLLDISKRKKART